ncbi:hypothetical protein SUGI_0151400 [Cryptomeria japonica]|nr:hypothetical protein SUGI_0151400 [Cryptomeria japonica]
MGSHELFIRVESDRAREKESRDLSVELARLDQHRISIPHPFEEIEGSLAHKLTLELWEKEEEVLSRRIDLKDTRRMSIQNEIYQLLEFYFVLQGFVLTALFQTFQAPNHVTCKSSWSPFAFSLLVLLAALAALHYKFKDQLEIEELLQEEKQDCRSLFNCITDLRSQGALFDINTIKRSHCSPSPAPKVGLSHFLLLSVCPLLRPNLIKGALLETQKNVLQFVEIGANKDTIVLRDMHRYVWRQVRMELPPQECKKISIKAPTTFFRMGAMLKLNDQHEKDLKIYIDTEQLAGRNNISICKDENGRYFLQEHGDQ